MTYMWNLKKEKKRKVLAGAWGFQRNKEGVVKGYKLSAIR